MPFVTTSASSARAGKGRARARLDAEDADERRRAARLTPATAAGLRALGARLSAERDPAVRTAILNRLGELASEPAARVLAAVLSAPDASLRNGAVAALRGMPGPALAVLPVILQSPDADLRLFGVTVLQGLAHPQAVDRVAEILAAETDVNVVAAAVEALAEIGRAEHLPALRGVRDRFAAVAFLRFACDFAIARLSEGGPAAGGRA